MAGPAHRSVSNIRPSITSPPPGSPHTPVRAVSSQFGSPSALRADEDCVVIELGSRFMRAGFAGDGLPKAIIGFHPEGQRRAGDYRDWRLDYGLDWIKRVDGQAFGDLYELWKLDLRGVDLGLVGDKIERAVRESFTKYLLIDSRPRRMALVLPSALPLPLLSAVLDTLFNSFQPPTISLMSAPVVTTVAAGLRSALVLDIGWSETVCTAIYEYREVFCRRTVRAGKCLHLEMLQKLTSAVMPLQADGSPNNPHEKECRRLLSFEECEEVVARMAWCRSSERCNDSASVAGTLTVQNEGAVQSTMRTLETVDHAATVVSIPLMSTQPPTTLRLPFSTLAEPCEAAFFANGLDSRDLDDEELPLDQLVYRSLLCLPIDIRSVCMSRITFVGGGSNIPGLKKRIMDDVRGHVRDKGWDPVHGKTVKQQQMNASTTTFRNRQTDRGRAAVMGESDKASSSTRDSLRLSGNPAFESQEADPIEAQIRREANKETRPTIQGVLKAVDSMGSWTGASLFSQLKISSVSSIEREQWLQQGAAGASKQGEVVTAKQRQTIGPGGLRSFETTSWSLGTWS